MRDPVEAEDGHNYERKQIMDWFAICQSKGQPITSPIARVPMPQTLRSNQELKHAIDAAILECAAVTGLEGIDSIHKLNEIFKHLVWSSEREGMPMACHATPSSPPPPPSRQVPLLPLNEFRVDLPSPLSATHPAGAGGGGGVHGAVYGPEAVSRALGLPTAHLPMLSCL
jgi:hypothetical protein